MGATAPPPKKTLAIPLHSKLWGFLAFSHESKSQMTLKKFCSIRNGLFYADFFTATRSISTPRPPKMPFTSTVALAG